MSVVADYVGFASLPKILYLYDTFCGIPPGYDADGHSSEIYRQEPDAYEQVRNRFKPYANVRIVKGVVPNTFAEAAPGKIAFLHIDMNSTKSEIAALDHLFDRVSIGGMIILDDFGWLRYERQAHAEVEFMDRRGHAILELPTGQGLVVKR